MVSFFRTLQPQSFKTLHWYYDSGLIECSVYPLVGKAPLGHACQKMKDATVSARTVEETQLICAPKLVNIYNFPIAAFSRDSIKAAIIH
jgi:hypothetical protein